MMTPQETEAKISAVRSALIEHDARQKSRNRFRLGIYFQALEDVREAVSDGDTLRAAILRSFTGSLADTVLRAASLPVRTRDEYR